MDKEITETLETIMSITSPTTYRAVGAINLSLVSSMSLSVFANGSRKPGLLQLAVWKSRDVIGSFPELDWFFDLISGPLMKAELNEREDSSKMSRNVVNHLLEYVFENDSYALFDGILLRLTLQSAWLYSDFHALQLPPFSDLDYRHKPLKKPVIAQSRFTRHPNPWRTGEGRLVSLIDRSFDASALPF